MACVLIVTKPPEFTAAGGLVLSQCEPYTGGWKLMLWEDGVLESLLAGTYDEMIALQGEWDGLAPAEIRSRARDLGMSRPDKFSTTVAMPPAVSDAEATQIIDRRKVEQAMQSLENDVPKFSFLPARTSKGAMVAEVHDDAPVGAVAIDQLDQGNAMDIRGVILDLGPVSGENPAALMSFVSLVVGRLGLSGRFVWVVAPPPFLKLVEEAGLDEVIRAFGSVEEALSKL
ncbi:MAG: hypothetical protein JW909_13900 [Planctomycetes bacterium]|nr:hypothetical protein [Planctomycetota bacterium]